MGSGEFNKNWGEKKTGVKSSLRRGSHLLRRIRLKVPIQQGVHFCFLIVPHKEPGAISCSPDHG